MHLQCFATILATVLSFVYGVQARPTAYLSTPTRSLEPRASIVDVDDDWIPATTVLPVDPNYAQMTPEDQSIARAKVYSNYIRTSCIRTLQVEIEADKIIRDFESREPGSERFAAGARIEQTLRKMWDLWFEIKSCSDVAFKLNEDDAIAAMQRLREAAGRGNAAEIESILDDFHLLMVYSDENLTDAEDNIAKLITTVEHEVNPEEKIQADLEEAAHMPVQGVETPPPSPDYDHW